MAVLLETTRGDVVIDLYTDECPQTCTNFVKLCKIKYYNNCLVHNIVPGFIAQTGDPTGTGRGGDSVFRLVYGEQARFFDDEIRKELRHRKPGMVGMAGAGKDMNASQFYFSLGADLDSLDGKHTVFGEVSEGLEVVTAIGEAFLDDEGRPLQNIRIRHTHILEDPFPDPPGLELHIPESSPEPEFAQGDRLEDDWKPTEDARGDEERAEESRKLEAHSRAVVLEMIGDLPEAEAKPPSDMLFVCKLNPVTTEEDLEIIFSRFGRITSCDIIRDSKTGDSLCYAFIGFDSDRAAEDAFFKMNNVLIDDRRIKVDFSQSVHHLWKQFRRFGRSGGNAGDLQGGEKPAEAGPRLQLRAGAGGYQQPSEGHRGLILDTGPPGPSGRHYEPSVQGHESYRRDESSSRLERSHHRDRDRHASDRHQRSNRPAHQDRDHRDARPSANGRSRQHRDEPERDRRQESRDGRDRRQDSGAAAGGRRDEGHRSSKRDRHDRPVEGVREEKHKHRHRHKDDESDGTGREHKRHR